MIEDLNNYQFNSTLLKGLIDNLSSQSKAQQSCSPEFQRFIFSQNSICNCKKHILNETLIHPKETGSQTFSKISQTILKTHYNDPASSISFSIFPVQDPPLKFLKKQPSLVFLNLSYAYFTSSKTLTPLHSFQTLVSLSLHNCALFDIPVELLKLPPKLQNLDLSENYLSEIPNEVKWEKLKNINLSINCFSSWPCIFHSNSFHLKTLILSFNDFSLASIPSQPLPELENLDISYCNLLNFPTFILQSKNLEILNIRGNFDIHSFYYKHLNEFNHLKTVYINGTV